MQCPFCNNEMKKGFIFGDGRSKVRWCQDGDKVNIIERAVTEKGCIANVKYSLARFDIESYFCPKCNKIIIDTEIKKG